MPDHNAADRRPIAARDTGWARAIAGWLVRRHVSADGISFFSVVVAAIGAAALVWLPAPAGPLIAAVCIPLRLLCNLFDGMVALEGGTGSSTGPLWNEFPDRISDSLLLVALGYAAQLAWLGWLGALLAVLTAYIRATGGALGVPQDFRGPLAKQQRMLVMAVGCLIAAAAPWWPRALIALPIACWIIAIGSALTCLTRTRALAITLRAKSR